MSARLLLSLVPIALGATCVFAPGTPCDVDTDCRSGARCVDGFCSSEGEGEGEGEGAGEGEGEGAGEGEGEGEGASEGEGEGEGASEGEGEGAGEGEGEGEGAPLPVSCAALLLEQPATGSGLQWIDAGSGPIEVFCEMTRQGGGWTRVALVDPALACPSPWVQVSAAGTPACHRASSAPQAAALFPTVLPWREVLGAIEGRSEDSPDAFGPGGGTLDANYVDGVSVSAFGTTREHLFTLASSHDGTDNDCPCPAGGNGPAANAFATDRWVCDRPAASPGSAYDPTPLWDALANECAPVDFVDGFFVSAEAPSERSDPLEVRILLDEDLGNEDLALTRLELYVR